MQNLPTAPTHATSDMDGDLPQPMSKKARKLSSRIENEDKSTQIRINETNIQTSNSDIGNKNGRGHGYDVCGKGEIIHSSRKYFHAGILNEIAD